MQNIVHDDPNRTQDKKSKATAKRFWIDRFCHPAFGAKGSKLWGSKYSFVAVGFYCSSADFTALRNNINEFTKPILVEMQIKKELLDLAPREMMDSVLVVHGL